MAPEGVAVHTARMHVMDHLPAVERLSRMVPHARQAARDLATLRPHVVVYACTSGSFFRGHEWTRDYMSELSQLAGCRVVATAEAMTEALRAVGARRIGVATPYGDDVNELLTAYLRAADFEVVAMAGASLHSNWDVCTMSEAMIADLARKVAAPDADAVFFACTAVPIVSQIGRLEAELGRPVITANQATFWAALGACGIHDGAATWGRLMSADNMILESPFARLSATTGLSS
jgi:maleate cis-trans isomerase